MDLAREVCSAASSVRKANRLRNRLPLRSLTVAAPDAERLAPFVDLIADEVNVKTVELTDRRRRGRRPRPAGRAGRARPAGRRRRAEDHPGGEGRRLGARRRRRGRGRRPPPGRRRVHAAARAPGGDGQRRARPATAGSSCSTSTVTPELEAEGMVRDVVRGVNEIRRARGPPRDRPHPSRHRSRPPRRPGRRPRHPPRVPPRRDLARRASSSTARSPTLIGPNWPTAGPTTSGSTRSAGAPAAAQELANAAGGGPSRRPGRRRSSGAGGARLDACSPIAAPELG